MKYCSEMNIAAIAEGIETEEELKCILKLGVRYGQGFLFAKPESGFYEQVSGEPWVEILNEYQPKECGEHQIGSLSKMGTVLTTESLSFEKKGVGIASYVEQEHILIADEKDDIRKVLKKALNRKDNWDDPIVVQKKGRYYGTVEMRELLLNVLERYVPEDTEIKGNENE